MEPKTLTFDRAVRPNILPWPPMIYAVAALAACVLGRLVPLPFVWDHAIALTGAAVLFAGVVLDFWAMATMWRMRTSILPHRGADALVTTGPFRFTRNPIYLGNTIAMLGLSVYLDNGWFALLGFGAAIAVDRLAIRREEAHLAARFGQAWYSYAALAPRWFY
jgi:protein-S-isoprenylcysteine O-methyltransferase Ste14